ncbi:MAG: hypothetical protein K5897_11240 [Eubacterium sp.]|nr:hypothetical protein [Eubacterium sp.]
MKRRICALLLSFFMLFSLDLASFAETIRNTQNYRVFIPLFPLSCLHDFSEYCDHGIVRIGWGGECVFALAVSDGTENENEKYPLLGDNEVLVKNAEWNAVLPDGCIVKPHKVSEGGYAFFAVPYEQTGQMTVRALLDGNIVAEFTVIVSGVDINGDPIKGLNYTFGKPYYVMENGKIAKEWFEIDGKWYYSDHEGVMQTGWKKLSYNGVYNWYYFCKNASSIGCMFKGWHKIDGTWYYFRNDGSMASNEWIGGYWLSKSGAWRYQPKGRWRKNSKGWWFEDERGWYPKGETVKINGVEYSFRTDGYLIEK